MANLSDLIEQFISRMIEKAEDDYLEIQRNELACYFGCAPSQINYVLSTRFTVDRGYYIESKRGGGGCIRIVKLDVDKNTYLTNIIENKIGNTISKIEAEQLINAFFHQGLISLREARIMVAALDERILSRFDNRKEELRANLIKNMLIELLRE